MVVAGVLVAGDLGLSLLLLDDIAVVVGLLSFPLVGTKTLILLLGYGYRRFKLNEFGELKSSFLTKKKFGLLLLSTL